MNQNLSIIILAAGKGTRMKSQNAKVLHEVFYAPMIEHVLHATIQLHAEKTVVVVGHQQERVKNQLLSFEVIFAEQTEQLGTGHAVLSAEKALEGVTGTIMILCGDTPLIRPQMLEELLEFHRLNNSHVTLLTTHLSDPTNYGRIISDQTGNILSIVEQKDANDEQLRISEINAGIYCVDKQFLFSTLQEVGTNNSQGEVYLTDIVHLAVAKGLRVKKYTTSDTIDVLGVNSRLELSLAQTELQLRRNKELMSNGVSMINPETIRVSKDSDILADSLIEACVQICQGSVIGRKTVVETGAVLKHCRVGDGAIIGAHCYLVNTTVDKGESVAPNTTCIA
ncbi:bifunctional N-acetylglucosamine-1-phosphate uridyltransferase/glucosamine-1-phosphate acetyltransferase [Desulforhopalus sp. IMCC35007]|nr:sugar phosphate nucleotidyltransferase [Desulforhopalus sp. IMCC35007]TKB06342.1 bifunctional N-acetylglucosamine-1-phosphate uridyltransferase/glucosamine-1-phosphate acetyltransferase [Desulforhopalus sp. IMCC35007]